MFNREPSKKQIRKEVEKAQTALTDHLWEDCADCEAGKCTVYDELKKEVYG